MTDATVALGSIVLPCMTRRQARTALYEAGWEFVGGGSFASVWRSPDHTRVVKVTKPDPGGEATVRAAQKHPDNPHLPTIYGFERLANGGFAVETEALEPGYDAYLDLEDDPDFDSFTFTNRPTGENDLADALRALLDERSAADARVSIDEHEENVMARPDGTVVLTDLLYSPAALRHAANYYPGGHRKGSAHNLQSARICAGIARKRRAA